VNDIILTNLSFKKISRGFKSPWFTLSREAPCHFPDFHIEILKKIASAPETTTILRQKYKTTNDFLSF
jgi:hypothetical protein